MKYVLSQKEPAGTRILLIESGSRSIMEGIVAHLRANWGKEMPIDLITCYGGLPAGLDENTRVFHVADYSTPELRRKLADELRARPAPPRAAPATSAPVRGRARPCRSAPR